MNNKAYTSYPCEREILLQEGKNIWIMEVERGFAINNPLVSWKSYHGVAFNIVHIYTQ